MEKDKTSTPFLAFLVSIHIIEWKICCRKNKMGFMDREAHFTEWFSERLLYLPVKYYIISRIKLHV